MTELDVRIGSLLRQKTPHVWFTTPDASVYQAIEMMAESK